MYHSFLYFIFSSINFLFIGFRIISIYSYFLYSIVVSFITFCLLKVISSLFLYFLRTSFVYWRFFHVLLFLNNFSLVIILYQFPPLTISKSQFVSYVTILHKKPLSSFLSIYIENIFKQF